MWIDLVVAWISCGDWTTGAGGMPDLDPKHVNKKLVSWRLGSHCCAVSRKVRIIHRVQVKPKGRTKTIEYKLVAYPPLHTRTSLIQSSVCSVPYPGVAQVAPGLTGFIELVGLDKVELDWIRDTKNLKLHPSQRDQEHCQEEKISEGISAFLYTAKGQGQARMDFTAVTKRKGLLS